MDVFELVTTGRLDELEAALAADATLATFRHPSGASPLAWAHYAGKPETAAIIRRYLPELDPHEAIIDGDLASVQSAISRGWDGNALSPDGFTPLGLAAFFGHSAIFDLLLPLTADVNAQARNAQKVAALHAATAVRDVRMVTALLRAGADPDLAQAGGFTPLHVAASHGDAAVAALLVLGGADPTTVNDNGQNAIALAEHGGHAWLAQRLAAIAGRISAQHPKVTTI